MSKHGTKITPVFLPAMEKPLSHIASVTLSQIDKSFVISPSLNCVWLPVAT